LLTSLRFSLAVYQRDRRSMDLDQENLLHECVIG